MGTRSSAVTASLRPVRRAHNPPECASSPRPRWSRSSAMVHAVRSASSCGAVLRSAWSRPTCAGSTGPLRSGRRCSTVDSARSPAWGTGRRPRCRPHSVTPTPCRWATGTSRVPSWPAHRRTCAPARGRHSHARAPRAVPASSSSRRAARAGGRWARVAASTACRDPGLAEKGRERPPVPCTPHVAVRVTTKE